MRARFTTTAVAALVLSAAPLWAFKPGIHKDISGVGMSAITATVDGGRTIQFTSKAMDEVKNANWRTDIGPGFFVGKNHFTEDLFSASSSRLIDLRQQIVADITAAEPNGEEARKKLGTALHTLQDFYAHSNWIERGNSGIFSSLGRSTLANPSPAVPVCPGDPEVLPTGGGVLLTTGFYSRLFGCGPIQTPGKCYHGNVPAGCDGIHKDNPGRPFHGTARALATTATEDYIQQILDDPAVAGNDLAKKCLLGVANGTLGMVIDDTGSMGPEISAVKSQVAAIVARVQGTDDEPKQYLLVRFGDPDVGPPFSTDDASVFLPRVNALSPRGGGDCPELAATALIQAIGASRRDSTLFVFTDASAKDASLFRAVAALANAKRIRVSFLLTGTCSPVDPAYKAIAERTGGQLFLLSQFELTGAFELIEPQLRDDFVTVLLAKDVLSSESRSFAMPIDSTVSKAIFTVSLDSRTSVELFDPTGMPVADGDPGVSITNLSRATLITVDDPAVGVWQLNVAGSGDLSVGVNANSPLDVATVEFVERVNPIHQALAPIPGQPVVGTTPMVLARLLGSYTNAEFELLDPLGRSLGPLSLALGDEDAASDEFVGLVPLPSGDFRISASGLDENGEAFQRLFPPTFRAQTVAVGVDLAAAGEALPIGETTTIEFTVTNFGNADTFQVAASDNRGFVSRVEPLVLTLGPGATASFEVDLTVPGTTEEGAGVLLTATATSVTDPTTANSAALDLVVADLDTTPPDIFSVVATPDVLWPPNHKMRSVSIEVDAFDEGDGTAPTCLIVGVSSNEPVNGSGDGNTDVDWEITGALTVNLRAERAGGGDGRIYTVQVDCSDTSGNSATATVEVTVPRSKGKK